MKDPVSSACSRRDLIAECVAERIWAVVGATNDPSKFGNRVFCCLRDAGYVVYPINLRGEVVAGDRAYRALADLPERPAVVNIVVPPAAGVAVVAQCAQLGIARVWFQPGAESLDALELCRQHEIAAVFGACAMVFRRQWPSLLTLSSGL